MIKIQKLLIFTWAFVNALKITQIYSGEHNWRNKISIIFPEDYHDQSRKDLVFDAQRVVAFLKHMVDNGHRVPYTGGAIIEIDHKDNLTCIDLLRIIFWGHEHYDYSLNINFDFRGNVFGGNDKAETLEDLGIITKPIDNFKVGQALGAYVCVGNENGSIMHEYKFMGSIIIVETLLNLRAPNDNRPFTCHEDDVENVKVVLNYFETAMPELYRDLSEYQFCLSIQCIDVPIRIPIKLTGPSFQMAIMCSIISALRGELCGRFVFTGAVDGVLLSHVDGIDQKNFVAKAINSKLMAPDCRQCWLINTSRTSFKTSRTSSDLVQTVRGGTLITDLPNGYAHCPKNNIERVVSIDEYLAKAFSGDRLTRKALQEIYKMVRNFPEMRIRRGKMNSIIHIVESGIMMVVIFACLYGLYCCAQMAVSSLIRTLR